MRRGYCNVRRIFILLHLGEAKSYWLKNDMPSINFCGKLKNKKLRFWRWGCVQIILELAPKKKDRQRRNALFPLVKDFCPLCGRFIRVQYRQKPGPSNWNRNFVSTFKAKRCERCCPRKGLTLKQGKGKSDRVCSTCGGKIGTLNQLSSFVASTLYGDSQEASVHVCGEER